MKKLFFSVVVLVAFIFSSCDCTNCDPTGPGGGATVCNDPKATNYGVVGQCIFPTPTLATLSWKMCSGSPSNIDQCQQVGGLSASSYSLTKNGDYKIYAMVTHAGRAGCKISGSITSNLGQPGGSNPMSDILEQGNPNPLWIGYGFDTRVAPSTTAYKASLQFVERCQGYADNNMSGVVGLAVQ